MNLFYDPSIKELKNLMREKVTAAPVHNIVVDYDGEVILDPEFKYAGIPLNRYKYQLRFGSNCDLSALLKSLLDGFNDSIPFLARQSKNTRVHV